jgi:hypothetical protein
MILEHIAPLLLINIYDFVKYSVYGPLIFNANAMPIMLKQEESMAWKHFDAPFNVDL